MRDVTALLDPIPGDSPAGPDLRYAGLYDTLQELRREDDTIAPRGIWQTKLKAADWNSLIETASEALATRTKDLQIGVWLAEALVARDGLAGLPRGFDALAALVEHFWPVLWPQIGEENDLDTRLAPLDWLDTKLPARFALTDIAESEPPVTWHHYLSTQRALAIPGANKGKGEKPSKTMEALMQLVDQTPSAFYQQRAAELTAALEAVSRLKAQLRAQCGDAAPSFTKVGGALAALQGFIRAELIKRGLPVEAPPADEPPPQPEEMTMPDDIDEPATVAAAEAAPESEEAAPPATPAAASGPLVLRDRAHAYRVLTQVAQYLERTEPHSPVPHLIMRAVAWGSMSLPELLDEILREDTNSIYRLLGLGQQGGGGNGGGGGPKPPRTPRG
jgi:type VI secretion system ImpA family protein